MAILSDILSILVPLILLCAFIPEIPIMAIENFKEIWKSIIK